MELRCHKVTSGTDFFHILCRPYLQATGISPFCLTISTTPTPQVLGSLFYAYYVFVRLCIPQFRSISLQLFDLRAMVLCVFNSILPGKIAHLFVVRQQIKQIPFYTAISLTQLMDAVVNKENHSCRFSFAGVLVLFLAFFAFLHCWLNAFAEMLRFADRMFYKVCLLPFTL